MKIQEVDKPFLLVLAVAAVALWGVFLVSFLSPPVSCLGEAQSVGALSGVQDTCKSQYEWWSLRLTGALVSIAAIQGFLFVWQLILIGKGTEGARIAAEAATTAAQADILAQRAYVRLSHSKAPGLTINPVASNASISVEVKNLGRTPATVLAIFLKSGLGIYENGRFRPPLRPNYHGGVRLGIEVHLAADDFRFYDATIPIEPLLIQSIMSAHETNVKMCIYGYVDYLDCFGVRHIGGYARWYEPHRDDSEFCNLVPISEPGFNYDRRAPKNWDETHPPPASVQEHRHSVILG